MPIVFMGLHPSLAPSHVMRHSSVDYVIAGEAENVIADLLEAIAEPAGRDTGRAADIGEVGNLWYRVGEEPTFTQRAELVDLDALPLPDKELFRPYVSHRSSYCAMVSRGCPYRCSFCEETCSKQLYGGNYYRRKSVDTVMRELVEGKRRYRYREVIFKDSYLSGNQAWLAEFIDRYRREIDVPFKCFCTISGFNGETARLLKEGGCYSIEFGLQTWNDRLRREVLDRRETTEEALAAFAVSAATCVFGTMWTTCSISLTKPVRIMYSVPTATASWSTWGESRSTIWSTTPLPVLSDMPIEAGDLPADAVESLAMGHESDFYDQTTGSVRSKNWWRASRPSIRFCLSCPSGWCVGSPRENASDGCDGFRRR